MPLKNLAANAANAQANILAALLNGGYLRLYSGDKPTNADARTSQTVLAELRFSSPAFGAADAGTIAANLIASDARAKATGKARWFRCFESDGTTAVMDGTVGLEDSGCDLEMNSVDIQINAEVAVESFVHSISA